MGGPGGFLHKVEPGPADRAYGIHVAKLAGVPKEVVARAEVLLHALEQDAARVSLRQAEQLPLGLAVAPADASALEEFKQLKKDADELQINSLTPLDALLKLAAWKKRLAEWRPKT